jgi:DNA-directed RNA polymerase sigma subunit (sigma70/sigma32)
MSIVHSPDVMGPAAFGCAQAGCRDCQDRLVRQHERLVHFVLGRQVTDDVDYTDLLQVGRIGLWRAVLHFAEPGVAFSTYAVIAIQRRLGCRSLSQIRPQIEIPPCGLAVETVRSTIVMRRYRRNSQMESCENAMLRAEMFGGVKPE